MWSSRIQAWLFAVGMACCSLSAGAAELTVSAAASLTNAFKEIAQAYALQHAETKVQLNFGASGALLQQMAKGAPVDVFASADQETMDQAQKLALVTATARQDFARNQLVLIVPMDSKLVLGKLGDLGERCDRIRSARTYRPRVRIRALDFEKTTDFSGICFFTLRSFPPGLGLAGVIPADF